MDRRSHCFYHNQKQKQLMFQRFSNFIASSWRWVNRFENFAACRYWYFDHVLQDFGTERKSETSCRRFSQFLSDSSGYLGPEGKDPFSRQSRSFTESVLLEDNTDRVPVKKRSWTCQNPVCQIRQTSQFCELSVSKKNMSCDVPLKLFFFHWRLSESRRVSKKLQG